MPEEFGKTHITNHSYDDPDRPTSADEVTLDVHHTKPVVRMNMTRRGTLLGRLTLDAEEMFELAQGILGAVAEAQKNGPVS